MALEITIDENTHLRSVSLADAAELFALIDASRPYLRQWMNWVDQTQSVEDIEKFVRDCMDQLANGQGPVCGIFHDQVIVGVCGFRPIDKANRSAEMGYWLAESASGRGIMTRCVRALIDHAFQEMDLNRIELRAAEENRRSQGIAKRLGFTEEGTLRDAEWLSDRFVDHVVYSVLRREWDSLKDV